MTHRTRRIALPLLGLLAVAAGLTAQAWRRRSQEPMPEAMSLVLAERDEVARSFGPFAPARARPLTAAEALAQRLAALAAAVEAGRVATPDSALASFDVEGLRAALAAQLAAVQSSADVSVHVRELQSQRVLFDWYGDTPMIPASNQKLVTSAAALDLLGSDYTFETIVAADARVLYVRGEGDPVLMLDDVQAIADRVVAQVDIAAFDRLVIDDSAFSAARWAPDYPQNGPGYAHEAPSGALSANFNTIEITVWPVNKRALGVSVVPASTHVRVDDRAKVGRRRTLAVSTRADDTGHTVVDVQGTLPARAAPVVVRRRITDPGLFAGSLLAGSLAAASATEPLPIERGELPEGADILVEHESVPLIEVLDAGLAYSNNFIAEQVLRTLAWRMTGDPGDWDAGQQILHDYWAALVGDAEDLVVVNAAGLSRAGRATTSGLVDLISIADRVAAEGPGLLTALPVAGDPGTMHARLRLSGKRVRAKTGTLAGVSGLTGIITREDGTPQIGFSILINAHEGSQLDASKRRRIEDGVVMSVLTALDDFEAQRAGIADPRGQP